MNKYIKTLVESIIDDFEINPSSQDIEQEYILKQKIKEFNENEISKDVTEYEIPYGVTEIPDEKFEACKKLTSVVIPTSVRRIGHGAFFDCGSLTSVVIPNSVTSIGDFAFYLCKQLSSVGYDGVIYTSKTDLKTSLKDNDVTIGIYISHKTNLNE